MPTQYLYTTTAPITKLLVERLNTMAKAKDSQLTFVGPVSMPGAAVTGWLERALPEPVDASSGPTEEDSRLCIAMSFMIATGCGTSFAGAAAELPVFQRPELRQLLVRLYTELFMQTDNESSLWPIIHVGDCHEAPSGSVIVDMITDAFVSVGLVPSSEELY